ncbi:MAG TPA: hemerythrin domain-containing protein [Streptosporangiaceae bacterium]|nr:hemerythrin domain-containing protein [Streptosporangiaceae bacterium]
MHAHHGLEDALFLPALRGANPALARVVAKPEADHRDVFDLLYNIAAGAAAPASTDTVEARSRLAGALAELAKVLLEHLTYEEHAIGPTLLQTDWWQ